MTTTYHRDWQITGPIQPTSLNGKPSAYTIWEARHLVGGRRYSESDRPYINVSREAVVDYIDTVAENDDEPARPVKWGVRLNRDGFWQAFARIRGGIEPIYARAKDADDAEAKLRTRLAALRYYPAGDPTR
jgi:hypothetical protein